MYFLEMITNLNTDWEITYYTRWN